MLTKIFKIRNRYWVLPNSLIVFMKMIILFFTYDLFLHFNCLLGSTDITLENHWPLLNKQIPVASSLVAYFKELPMWVVAWLQINASKSECLPCSFQWGLIYEAIVCFLWFVMAKYGTMSLPLFSAPLKDDCQPPWGHLRILHPMKWIFHISQRQSINIRAYNLKHPLHMWEKFTQAFTHDIVADRNLIF